MKNSTMPIRISPKDWFSPKALEISPAPCLKKISRKLLAIMAMGLNFASQATMTAVKPRPPAMVVVMVWLGTAHQQEAGQTADRAGEKQGSDDDLSPP